MSMGQRHESQRPYIYLHDVLDNALDRLECAQRSVQGDPALDNALEHIRGALRQTRAAIDMTPRARGQQEKGGQS